MKDDCSAFLAVTHIYAFRMYTCMYITFVSGYIFITPEDSYSINSRGFTVTTLSDGI